MIAFMMWLIAGMGQVPTSTEFGRQMPLELGGISECPVSMDDYVLNAGDSLLVMVKGSYNYSYPTQITPTGQLMIMLPSSRRITTFGQTFGEVSLINLEAVGYVEVVDVDVAAARGVVADAFAKFIRPVQIDFVLLGTRLLKVNMMGEVHQPGSYLGTPFMRVEDALDQAGGVTPMGSISDVSVVRRWGDTLRANLRRYREEGELEANPTLFDGDIIYVPKMDRFVVLTGAAFSKRAAQAPGIQAKMVADTLGSEILNSEHLLEFRKGERVCDFLAQRAVFLAQSDLANCYIQRGDERIFFDMQSYLAGKEAENPLLEHGDVITVPRTERFVYVNGEVRSTKAVFYNQALTLNQYLSRAGGLNSAADVRAIRVIYPDGRTVRAHPDVKLEPGATIYVPRRPLYDINEWMSLVAAGLSLVTVILAFGD